ncbi:hypothetical protein BAUCODRAFT_432919 [Baudoinia panamericana UAMH 10762]|uniref:Uncharacterized protein n=1 Tax=Baudoinia panamericana (strain UAMH 10762) TaxID=717646 RepID=M2LR64_BAUPA|nr:uncharacterized protein BAUCODRAFT_432919 [Baudoinia panamericana UAMH 10762]EMC96927.1 hypothetical protein BAUCODRAFT_432919 [Baudoinia panamericana UAMH 10762]
MTKNISGAHLYWAQPQAISRWLRQQSAEAHRAISSRMSLQPRALHWTIGRRRGVDQQSSARSTFVHCSRPASDSRLAEAQFGDRVKKGKSSESSRAIECRTHELLLVWAYLGWLMVFQLKPSKCWRRSHSGEVASHQRHLRERTPDAVIDIFQELPGEPEVMWEWRMSFHLRGAR